MDSFESKKLLLLIQTFVFTTLLTDFFNSRKFFFEILNTVFLYFGIIFLQNIGTRFLIPKIHFTDLKNLFFLNSGTRSLDSRI